VFLNYFIGTVVDVSYSCWCCFHPAVMMTTPCRILFTQSHGTQNKNIWIFHCIVFNDLWSISLYCI